MRYISIGFVVLLAGCVANVPNGVRHVETPAGHDYVLAFLLAGTPANELGEQAVADASVGHRAHIEDMAAEGVLLLAAPFGEPRTNDRWRGIYVFDSPDVDKAYEFAQADPAVVAGLFDLELVPWRSDVDLRPMRAQLEREKAAGLPFVPASYVLAISKPGARGLDVLSHLDGKGRLICAGELGGARDGQALLLLAADTVEEARMWLNSGEPQVSWELSGLWATALLGDLAEDE